MSVKSAKRTILFDGGSGDPIVLLFDQTGKVNPFPSVFYLGVLDNKAHPI